MYGLIVERWMSEHRELISSDEKYDEERCVDLLLMIEDASPAAHQALKDENNVDHTLSGG